ncbi:MAG: hypothetical protein GY820_41805 [Gammaproteobacteria bacterium]|nr:hypothetical protein [Gammaproteobacteria bacterium]
MKRSQKSESSIGRRRKSGYTDRIEISEICRNPALSNAVKVTKICSSQNKKSSF